MLESKSRRVVMVQNIYLNKNEKNKISFQDVFLKFCDSPAIIEYQGTVT